MNKNKLLSIFTVAAILGALTMPTKKAEAGVILSAPLLGIGGIALGGGALIVLASSERANDNALTLNERLGPMKKYLMASMALFVLDAEEAGNPFDTIPTYLMQEIKDQAAIKAELIEANADGLKEVVFSNAEVDELFDLADSDVSLDQLDELRNFLTTTTLQ